MIDFEQEIETRLAHFQHLTGKGNVKDGNRTLYEIVRLMLGMITQHKAATMPTTPTLPPSALISETVPAPLPEAAMADFEVAAITPNALNYPETAHTIDKVPVHAPYGYTRAGHVRLIPPTHGLTETGLPRKAPLKPR